MSRHPELGKGQDRSDRFAIRRVKLFFVLRALKFIVTLDDFSLSSLYVADRKFWRLPLFPFGSSDAVSSR